MTTEVANPRFPVGLRVLVVDDDPLCLRIVEKMLKRCQYEGAAKIFTRHACVLILRKYRRRPVGRRRGKRARGKTRRGEARNAQKRGRRAGYAQPGRARAVAAAADRRSAIVAFRGFP